mgnify:CR=1 FL=1
MEDPVGARCDICPLALDRSGGPVPAAGPPDSPWVAVGEAPGAYEVQERRPFVGPSGQEFDRLVLEGGIPRRLWRVTNVLKCRPPERVSLEDYLDGLRRRNAETRRDNIARKANGLPVVREVPDPRTCCRGSLLRDIRGARGILALGAQSARSITSHGQILRWRGSPLRVRLPDPPDGDRPELADVPAPIPSATDFAPRAEDEVWVVPTLHPAFVMRGGSSPATSGAASRLAGGEAFAQVLELDVRKACRIFEDDCTQWDESGVMGVLDSPDAVGAVCRSAAAAGLVALDVETTGGHLLTTNLICVGLGWRSPDGQDLACVIPVLDPVALTSVWDSAQWVEVAGHIQALLTNPGTRFVAHNGSYDRGVMQGAGFAMIPANWDDTMVAHHSVVSDHPHGLGFVATMYTDARFWKDDVREKGKLDSKRVDPAVFYLYNQRDCLATLRVWPGVLADLKSDGQEQVYRQGLALVDVARQMQAFGMRIDLETGAAISNELRVRESECKARMEVLLAPTDYRDRMLAKSAKALDKARAKRLAAQADAFNPGGQVSLREALHALGVPIPERTPTGLLATGKQILADAAPNATPAGREFIRLLTSSPKDKAAGLHEFGWRPALKLRTTYIDRLPVHADGRIHPDFIVTGTVTGRFAHRNPNSSNFPKWMRKIVVPDPGHVLVGADAKQLEWRCSAHLSGDPALLSVFTSGRDPHREAAAQVFRKPPEEVTSIERDFWKRVLYAMSYGGTWETAFNSLRTEFPEVRATEIEEVFHRITRSFPRWMAWRNEIVAEGRKRGFLRSPLLGRRRYFRGSKLTEMLNFPAQSLAADTLHTGLLRLWAVIREEQPAWRVLCEVHDALVLEIPEADGEACKALLGKILPGPYRIRGVADPVTFPFDIKIGRTWAEV